MWTCDTMEKMNREDTDMLATPFGAIGIFVNGEAVSFLPEEHGCAWPVSGCCRVRLEGLQGQRISCLLEGAGDGLGSSGEGYQAVEFCRGNRNLVIGTETDREDRIVRAGADGLALELSADGAVVFGIAWTEDHRGSDDVRTWLAADPTLD